MTSCTKWCLVPACTNTSIKTPEKIFISVPRNEMRKRWLQLALRNPDDVGDTSNVFFCEDHFEMEKVMSNYHQYKMGLSQRIIMVDGALPSKFDCQQNIRKRMSDASASQPVLVKRRKTLILPECGDIQTTAAEQDLVITQDCTSIETTTKVEDDIDIEEHDVLENPRIGDLVMDLKNEISDEERQEDNKSELNTEKKAEHQQHCSKTIFKSRKTARLHINGAEHNSESNAVPEETAVKEETPDPEVKEENNPLDDKFAPILIINTRHSVIDGPPFKNIPINSNQSNKKKTVRKVLSINDVEISMFKGSFVNLEDWGPRLRDSPFFCKECGILFPTSNTFQSHNMTAHSLLVAINKKATKTTSKINYKKADAGKVCSHCNVTFPDGESLIDHLYQILYRHKISGVSNSSIALPPKTQKDQDEDTLPSRSTSNYYCCDVCYYYCKFRDNFTSHMSSNHSKVIVDCDAEPFNSQCRFCSNKFNSVRTYNQHITIYHRKEFWKDVTKKSNSKFPPSYTVTTSHRKQRPSEKKNVLKVKEVNNDAKSSKDKVLSKSSRHSYSQKLFLPKSVLFKCKKCSVHFISCADAISHTKVCQKVKGDWKCHICGKSFQSQDQKKHLLQHRLSSEQLKVYSIDGNTLSKILYQCPDCETYLHESSFTRHCNTSCEGELLTCTICELDIHSSSIKEHYECHDTMNLLRPNQFIIVKMAKLENLDIDRAVSEGSAPVSVKRETDGETAATKSHLLKVYYCAKCGTYCMRARRGIHADGNCDILADQRKSICNICGITTHSKYPTHKPFHKRFPEVTIMDMQFLSIDNDQPIIPPFPPFPKCKKCQVQYLRKASDKMHDCRDQYITCKHCREPFNGMAYKIHIRYHQYASKMSSKADVTPNSLNPGRLLSHSSQAALISKADQIKDKLVSEILYRCYTCNVMYENYDRTVEHCQKHYNNMASHGVIIKHCKICSFKFESTCYYNHKALHARNQTIKKESFLIITFNYAYLFLDNWFTNLKAQLKDIHQIAATSTYFYTRRVKLRVVRDGDPASTHFKCCKCEKYVHPASVTSHIRNNHCIKYIPGRVCTICKLHFTTKCALSQHKILHDKFEHFKIVYFNEKGDETFNEKLTESDPTMSAAVHVSETNKAHYFKCKNCRLAVGTRKLARNHKCGEAMMTRCNKCDLFFNVRGTYRPHKRLHEINPQFNRELIQITEFIPKAKSKTKQAVILSLKQRRKDDGQSKTNIEPLTNASAANSEDKNVEVYKCICGVHFISKSTVEKHIEVCSLNTDIIEEECSECGRVFDTTDLAIHLREHHSGDSTTQFNVILMKPQREIKRLLHHCESCDVYFMSPKTLNRHISAGHPRDTIISCSYCKLNFSSRTLLSHKCLHHEIKMQTKMQETPTFTSTQRRVYAQKKLNNIVIKSYSNKLHKCRTCEAHFLTHSALYAHSKNNLHFKVVHECDICQYKFSETTISKHRYIHHESMKLKREDFDIVTLGKPPVTTSDESDNESNDIGKLNTNKPEWTSHKVSMFSERYLTNINLNSYSKKLYKCTTCKAHFMRYGTLVCHLQRTHSNDVEKCDICNYGFNATTIVKHRYVHHERMKLKREDFDIVTIETRKPKAITETKHVDESTPVEANDDDEGTTAEENDDEMTKDENEENKNRDNVFEVPSPLVYLNVLFQCEKCKLNFVKLKTLENHILRCDGSERKTTCHKCGLLFTLSSFPKHFGEHHVKLNLDADDFRVLNQNGKIIKD